MPRVRAEAGLLAVIVENLISNALKYGPRHGGRVNISAERRPEGWRLSVAGGGTPLPQDEAERIFQPFHRAHGERRIPGVGLGLSICTRLVDRLGGSIGVQPGAETATRSGSLPPAAVQLDGPSPSAGALRMRSAAATASSRERTSSLRRMFFTCERTVSIESTRSSAIASVERAVAEQVDDLPLARGQRAADGPHALQALRRAPHVLDQLLGHPA